MPGSKKAATQKNVTGNQKAESANQQTADYQISSAQSPQATDAVTLLKNDHREVEGLFKKYEQCESAEEKQQIAQQVCTALVTHTMLEEEIFYPACREKSDDEEAEDALNEAQVEHDSAKLLIGDLLDEDPDEEFYDAKVKVLSEYIKHHVGEEEKPRDGIFAKAQKSGVDMSALGQRLQARKTELQAKAQANRLNPPQLRSLHLESLFDYNQEEDIMPRSNYRERDEQGRFTSDDDDYGRGRRSSRSNSRDYDDDRYESRGRGSQSRSRSDYDDDDDDRGGRGRSGWYGDSEGHSQAARQRGSQSRGRYEDDDDDYGRSSRSSRGGRGQGGWFGDSEGHAEASHRGWDERQGSSRSRSRDDDDDDRRSSRGRGGQSHGGWFGDSEGHAEASRRGWDERQGSSRSRSRDYDDDDDDRRSSRGRGGQSHGGWFGDSRGHAEAARRGWQSRD
jgi:hemerythrin superfamily protein